MLLTSIFDDLASLVKRKERRGNAIARTGIMTAMVRGAKPLANTMPLNNTFIQLPMLIYNKNILSLFFKQRNVTSPGLSSFCSFGYINKIV